MRGTAKERKRVLHQVIEIEAIFMQLELSRFDLREIQDLIENGEQRIRTRFDHLGEFLLLGR